MNSPSDILTLLLLLDDGMICEFGLLVCWLIEKSMLGFCSELLVMYSVFVFFFCYTCRFVFIVVTAVWVVEGRVCVSMWKTRSIHIHVCCHSPVTHLTVDQEVTY